MIAGWLAAALLLCCAGAAAPQDAPAPHEDTRTQYPAFLLNSYFSVDVGSISYPFSERELEPGFQATSIRTPHPAARIALVGHEFNRYLSAQLTYMRPVRYVTYTDVNGDATAHHVWTHFGGVTARLGLPIVARLSIYGEAGLGITSRDGFNRSDGAPVVRSAHYASWLAAAGVDRQITRTVDVTAGVTYSPGRGAVAEPHALLVSGGFRMTMRRLPQEEVEANRRSGDAFPANLLQVEYSTGFGYAINTFLSDRVPVFWGGHVKVDQGFAAHYDRNVFHTRKVFALDFGASVSSWRSRKEGQRFATLSAYPLFRFMFLRTAAADLYVCYSLAGPTYISEHILDGLDTGRHFTFQDFIGAGAYLGRHRNIVAGVKINHYSNGNIFTTNAGIKVPVTFTAGYAF
jgi:opacity protein-like surface antigen